MTRTSRCSLQECPWTICVPYFARWIRSDFIPQNAGIKEVIEAVRSINDDGLLSIVSHTSNKIFDEKHGKGSLGTALAAIHYKRENPNTILVGLDTQLAQEWLSDREEGELPDLVAINLFEDVPQTWADSKDTIEKYQQSLFKNDNTQSSEKDEKLQSNESDQITNSPIIDGMSKQKPVSE